MYLVQFPINFQMIINDVKAYQKENHMKVALADLSAVETELVREEMLKNGIRV